LDTSSHIIIGLGLTGLAQIDPVVSSSDALTHAILIGCVVGSNAPDFDIVYKIKGDRSYIKNHRSYSHSLPILPLWALLIFAIIAPLFHNISYPHLFTWIFIAVVIHVITDLLNVHGTQVLLPFKREWISFDVLPLFDPLIILFHFIGFFSLLFWDPGTVFLSIYTLIILYVSFRFFYQWWIKLQLKEHFVRTHSIKLIPKASCLTWDVLIETEEDFLFGQYFLHTFRIEHSVSKNIDFPEVVHHWIDNPTVNDFLKSTNYAYPFVEKRKNGYWLYWKDLRFRHKKLFPFLSIIYISSDGSQIYSTYTGWIYSLRQWRKVMKRLKANGATERRSI
jgi:inner membrane protein